jgi:hypothetical protein
MLGFALPSLWLTPLIFSYYFALGSRNYVLRHSALFVQHYSAPLHSPRGLQRDVVYLC